MKTTNKPLLRVAISELIQLHAFDHLLDQELAKFRNVFNEWSTTEHNQLLNDSLTEYLSKANLFIENISPAVIQQWIYAMSSNNINIAHSSNVFEEYYDYELA